MVLALRCASAKLRGDREIVLAAVQQQGLVLNIHAEEPTSFSLNREKDYLPVVQKIIDNFPKLRIVIEHISDKASVEFVGKASENISCLILVWSVC